jgi:hypothetical protein
LDYRGGPNPEVPLLLAFVANEQVNAREAWTRESSRLAFKQRWGDYVVMSHSIAIILLMQSSGKYFIHFKMLSSERLTTSASSNRGFIAEATSSDPTEGLAKIFSVT